MKQPPAKSIERLKKMTFASLYPLLVNKVEKNDRTKRELNRVIKWLTGYDSKKLKSLIKEEVTYGKFIDGAEINPKAHLITGAVCGYRVEEVKDPFMRKSKCLDKLIDELAKGRKMEKILRTEE